MFGPGLLLRGALSLLLAPRPAAACGGCFAPPAEPTLVTGHRMAFAISETQTVLWDQFQYQGDPEDFSWVLPVRPGAYVEVADDAWLAALDAFTSPVVLRPRLNCAGSDAGGGCACGAGSDNEVIPTSARGVDDGAQGGPGVSVVRRERVGPYDTVVLRAEEPDALTDWLVVNGYSIPDEIRPVIDAYVDEGNDFLALRLAPTVGVEQMEPVRVITPGGDYLLPLRMVAAGVGSYVDIKLFVIAEGRYTMPDMAEVALDERKLEYDFLDGSSNYLELRQAALAQNGGKSAIVTYARPRPFDTQNTHPNVGAVGYRTAGDQSRGYSAFRLADLYFAQAAVDRGKAPRACTPPLDEARQVVKSCLPDQGCELPGADQLGSSAFECDQSSDLATALTGMRPNRVWLTRFDMNLPSTALDADCVVSPAVADVEVQPFLDPQKYRNPPCTPSLFSAGTGSLLIGLWASSALLSRRRRRTGQA